MSKIIVILLILFLATPCFAQEIILIWGEDRITFNGPITRYFDNTFRNYCKELAHYVNSTEEYNKILLLVTKMVGHIAKQAIGGGNERSK